MYLVISDIHLHNWSQFAGLTKRGVNTRLQSILDAMNEALEVAERSHVKRCYIAGDLFHVRGSVAPSVLNPALELFEFWYDRGMEFRLIPGNHDLEGKHSDALTSAVQSLAHMGCKVCHKAEYFADDNVVMLPWYDKLDDLKAAMKVMAAKHPMSDAIIHAPMNGVIKGIPDHGLNPADLSGLGFARVFCGHYHNFRSFGNVYSIGALTHQTWGDVGNIAGYLLVDDASVVACSTVAPKFVDFPFHLKDDTSILTHCKGNYVRARSDVPLSEREIAELRNDIETRYQALGCIVQAQIKPKNAQRVSNVSTGVTLEASVADFVSRQPSLNDDQRKALSGLCDDILKVAAEVE